MRQDVPALRKFYPSEANAIDYHRKTGHELQAHVDDRQLSTGEIVTLSLLVSSLHIQYICVFVRAHHTALPCSRFPPHSQPLAHTAHMSACAHHTSLPRSRFTPYSHPGFSDH